MGKFWQNLALFLDNDTAGNRTSNSDLLFIGFATSFLVCYICAASLLSFITFPLILVCIPSPTNISLTAIAIATLSLCILSLITGGAKYRATLFFILGVIISTIGVLVINLAITILVYGQYFTHPICF